MESHPSLRVITLSLFFAGSCGGAGLSAGPGEGGETTTSTSCSSDPDRPAVCTVWTCRSAPAEYRAKMRCTARQPDGSERPPGGYECPASRGGLHCPGGVSGGSGPWICAAGELALTCERVSNSGGVCVVLIGEEGIDNDMRSVESSAGAHG